MTGKQLPEKHKITLTLPKIFINFINYVDYLDR